MISRPEQPERANSDNSDVMPPGEERVVLVDQNDVALGSMGKWQAHVEGRLHRAFSIFVFRHDGALLLQRRARTKYHTGGLWSNTCCGHPRPGEAIDAAAHRRLREEMGFDCALSEDWSFAYRADVGGGLLEHEYDHVFFGTADIAPSPDANEVEEVRWIFLADLRVELETAPASFTPWLRIALDQFPAGLLPNPASP